MRTIPRVAIPPPTTVDLTPTSCETAPDSNAPSSFVAPINTFSTADTRPRLSSGVTNGTIAPRTKTLIMSPALKIITAKNATQ